MGAMKPRTIRLPEDLDHLISDEAEKTGATESEVIRRVLSEYYCVRPGENSIRNLIRRVIKEVLSEYAEEHRNVIKPVPTQMTKEYDRTPKERVQSDDKSAAKPDVKQVLQVIKDFFDRGIEPTAAEVAEAVEMESRPLGRIMKEAGIQAVNCRRDGKAARRYTFELKDEIEDLLADGEQNE